MLTSLHIENIAVIESTDIEFGSRFNVLTGETGAGKSIVIDSINAILGERTPRDLIRSGCDSAVVTAVFENIDKNTVSMLSELGFNCDDATLLIQRKIMLDGRNVIRINGLPATVAILKEIGRCLINIHGQHDNQALLEASTHITFIDAVAENADLLAEYKSAYEKYNQARSRLQRLRDEITASDERKDYLRYQFEELSAAEIEVGERESLVRQRDLIRNSENIARALTSSSAVLVGDDDTDGVMGLLADANSLLAPCDNDIEQIGQLRERLTEFQFEIQDIADTLSKYLSTLDFEPGLIDAIESRLDYLFRLSAKYGNTEEEMLSRFESIKSELELLDNADKNISDAEQQMISSHKHAQQLADKLSDLRIATCNRFACQVCDELKYLDMPGVVFKCEYNKTELSANGQDEIVFLISANPGEAPKSISKIASGGELSRIMLAIKSVLADKNDVPTLIFDEIDTGISGSAASKVGIKLSKIANDEQVICVTHLAQIAALANHHYKISKHVDNEKTFTDVVNLDYDGRINEVARIMSGSTPSDNMLKSAKELIDYGMKI